MLLPPLQRLFRRVYDLIGPVLAHHIRLAMRADVAFLSLKPIEWFTRLWLGALLREDYSLVTRLHTSGTRRGSQDDQPSVDPQ